MADTPLNLAQKLLSVAKQCSYLQKGGKNDHFKYKFFRADDVREIVADALKEAGLIFLPQITGYEKNGSVTHLTFLFRVEDAETGEFRDFQWASEASDSQDKGLNQAITAGIKYWMLSLTLMVEGDPSSDIDASVPDNAWITSDSITRLMNKCRDDFWPDATERELLKAIGAGLLDLGSGPHLGDDGFEALVELLRDEYTGTAQQAWNAMQAYAND